MNQVETDQASKRQPALHTCNKNLIENKSYNGTIIGKYYHPIRAGNTNFKVLGVGQKGGKSQPFPDRYILYGNIKDVGIQFLPLLQL